MNNLRDEKERMIQLFITGVRAGLIAAAIMATLSMITFAQTTKSTIENTPTATMGVVTNDSLKHGKKSTERDTSVQTVPPAGPGISVAENVEIQHRFNELRRELLDDRAASIDWWLVVIAVALAFITIVLTFFGIVVVVAGYISFKRYEEMMKRFQEIETEAKGYVEEIKKHRDESAEILQDMTAEDVAEAPEEAAQAATSVRETPTASLIDRAIAQAVSLHQQGRIDEATEKWRAVAHITEGSDNDQAARAWLSVGYLLENLEESISVYDRAISLKPDFVEAYNNRGNEKQKQGQYEDALADYDEAIRLKPDYAKAYHNRGAAKDALDRIDEARQDFKNARDLARDVGDDSLADAAEQSLRTLDSQEDE